MSGALDRDPSLAGARAGALDDALGARQPAPRGGRAAADQMLVRYPDREPGGVVTAAVARVSLDSLLAGGDRVLYATEKPKRQTEAVARVGCLLVGERGLERGPGLFPVRRLERLPPLVKPAADRHIHRDEVYEDGARRSVQRHLRQIEPGSEATLQGSSRVRNLLPRRFLTCANNGACRDRTGDLRVANAALSQLS